jgi:hypothetical protein
LSLKLKRCYLSAIFLVSLQELTLLAFFPSRSPNESVNRISALNSYAVWEGVIYVKDCLISRELGTSNILTICCQTVHQKISFSLPETGESLASNFLYSDVCRVEMGDNCSSPAPKEGRTSWT